MRNGFLASLGGLLTCAGMAFSQVPYGYYQPYPGPPPGYGYGYGYPQAYAVPWAGGPAPGSVAGWNAYPAPTGVLTQSVPETAPITPRDSGSVPSAAPAPATPVPSVRPDVIDLTPSNPSSSAPHIQIVPQSPPAVAAIPLKLPSPEAVLPSHEEVVPASSCGSGGCGAVDGGCASCNPMVHYWGSAEYLLWYVKNQPVSVPILTTGSTAAALAVGAIPGALGAPGTSVISPSSFNMSTIPGGRLTVGMALDPNDRFGIEANGFLLTTRSAKFFAASHEDGDSVLAFPVTLLTAGSPPIEAVGVTSIPGFANLSTYLIATTRLWGGEANGLINVYRTNWLNVDALGGFRYLDLQESLAIGSNISVPVIPEFGAILDRFGTHNQFYGGQLGARAEVHYGRFFANLTGKVGLGDNHESITINGAQSVTFPGTSYTVYPSGFYAQPTNIGRQVRNELSVVPEGQAQVGLDVLRNVRLFAGYNFLYMSNVVRPGDQIDRSMNSALFVLPPTVLPPGTVLTPARPAALSTHTDFWAQGVSFGLEIRY